MEQQRCAKPAGLASVHEQSEEIFELVRSVAGGITEWRFDLASVDLREDDLESPTAIAPFLMRKLQALRHVGRRGVSTRITVVLGLINETLASLASIFPVPAPAPVTTFVDVLEDTVVDITSIASTHGWNAVLEDPERS